MKRILILLVGIVFVVAMTSGCSIRQALQPLPPNEIVMNEGMQIIATNDVGTMTITAGKGYKRYYTWEGDTRSVTMYPRKERWYGKYGIYFPGTGNHWNAHNRITRGVLEEAEMHFSTMEEALTFIRHPWRIGFVVYRDDGLVVYWKKAMRSSDEPGSTLSVEVWQVFVAGKKPQSLPGSQNDRLIVRQGALPPNCQ